MDSAEHHIRVQRTARYHTLGDPSTAPEVWFVLHGYRQLAGRFIRRFDALPGVATRERAVVAPEALSRFYVEERPGPHGPESRVGATWMTREDREHEIRDYVEYLDRLATHALGIDPGSEVQSDPRRLVVLGFSQGSETASRWCVYGRIRPSELILWGGGLAADLDLDGAAGVLRNSAITLVTGEEDRWAVGRARDGAEKLTELGLTPRLIRYAGGHRIDPATLSAHWPSA